jgi:hypothetical protein
VSPVPEETQRRFGILPLHEASGERKQERLLKKMEKLPPIGVRFRDLDAVTGGAFYLKPAILV